MSAGGQPEGWSTKPQARAGEERRPKVDTYADKFGKDAYREERRHPPEPSVCTGCGVVFDAGRWAWITPVPKGASELLCPACQRERDGFPAGVITLEGAFLAGHLDEILGLVKNQEEAERAEHPLNRIMRQEESEGVVTIATTDIHLPRRILEALHRAYEGEMDFQYGDDESSLRGRWAR